MSRHQVSPSSLLSSSHTTQLHYTNSYTYSHPNLNFIQYTIQILVPHVMWSAQAVCEMKNRPHSTPSIRLARNPKHVIVQWVGIATHRYVFTTTWGSFSESKPEQHQTAGHIILSLVCVLIIFPAISEQRIYGLLVLSTFEIK